MRNVEIAVITQVFVFAYCLTAAQVLFEDRLISKQKLHLLNFFLSFTLNSFHYSRKEKSSTKRDPSLRANFNIFAPLQSG